MRTSIPQAASPVLLVASKLVATPASNMLRSDFALEMCACASWQESVRVNIAS